MTVATPEDSLGHHDISSLLESIGKPLTTPLLLSREAFRERLGTFRPSTYFAKPVSLSPIVCARLGWTNASIDLLVCCKCQAALAITFHPKLTGEASRRITQMYRTKLCTSHDLTCPFHSDLFPCLSDEQNPVPTYLASVLPEATVDLTDHPVPKHIIREHIAKLMEAYSCEVWKLPKLDLSSIPMEFSNMQDNHDPFPVRLQNALKLSPDEECKDESGAILAICGWTALEPATNSDLCLECQTCLSRAQLTLDPATVEDTRDSEAPTDSDDPPAKRQRRKLEKPMNPVTAHRYYCPFVCGFPAEGPSTPLWQAIATSLFTMPEPRKDPCQARHKGEEALEAVRHILRSGLA